MSAPSAEHCPADYDAVLRHAEELGRDEGLPVTWIGVRSRPLLVRIGVGILAALLIVPAAILLEPTPPASLLRVLFCSTLVGLLAAQAGYMVSRWSLQAKIESRLVEERNAIIATITSLVSALEARDPHTRNHSARVAKLGVRLGREMGFSQAQLYEIHLGGLLHDVGKIGIPDAILLKPGGLTTEEYTIMKTHSALGARILAGIPGLQSVSDIVLCHHEMPDGRGYPRGLQGDEIPLGARIVAVCDTYISMAENRPYRQGRSLEKVMREIRRVAGRQLDASVVETLEALLRKEVEAYGRPMEGFSEDRSETEASWAA
jgi:putative nucleotidyltransferase with HDIG domain